MKIRTRKRLAMNAFCPTGSGGGQDNTCSSSKMPTESGIVKAGNDATVEYEVNPGHGKLLRMFRNNPEGVRGLASKDRVIVWKAGEALHPDMKEGLGLWGEKTKSFVIEPHTPGSDGDRPGNARVEVFGDTPERWVENHPYFSKFEIGRDKFSNPHITVNESRSTMPQVRKADWEEFLDYARSHTTLTREDAVDPHDLSAVQSEWSQDRVDGIPMEKLQYPILVSRDGYVLDGNHRWIKAGQEGVTIPVLRLGLDKDDALELVRSFPKSEYVANSNPEGCNQHTGPGCSTGSNKPGKPWDTKWDDSTNKSGSGSGTIIDKHGKSWQVTHIVRENPEGKHRHAYEIHEVGGNTNHAGVAGAETGWDKNRIMSVKVQEPQQRRGLATALYAHIEKHLGKLYENDYTTPDGEAFWKNRKATTNSIRLSARAKRKLLTNARKSGVGPNRIDPTRTTSMRRTFTQQLRKKFALLKGRLRQLVVGEDAFGLKELATNAFCPTGSGGGIDNSCSPSTSAVANDWGFPGKVVVEDMEQAVLDGKTYDSAGGYKLGVVYVSKQMEKEGGPQLKAVLHHEFTHWAEESVRDAAVAEGSRAIKEKSLRSDGSIKPGKESQYPLYRDYLKFNTPEQRANLTEPVSEYSRLVTKDSHGEGASPISEALAEMASVEALTGSLPGNATQRDYYRWVMENKPRHQTTNRFQFHSSPDKLAAFQDWIRGQMKSIVTSPTDKKLWQNYAQQGYAKGAGRAFDDVTKKSRRFGAGEGAFYEGSRSEFLRSSFGQPETVEKIQLLASRSFNDLVNVTDDVATRMGRHLVDGLSQGMNPRDVADLMEEDLELGGNRAETIARTEIIRAHAEGQLGAMERMGVKTVGAEVEWSTAGDERVCPECSEMEGKIYTLDDARGLIPMHPNCRCAWLPAGFDEPEGAEEDATENAFCPTGPGGGQDNSCGGGPSADNLLMRDMDDIDASPEAINGLSASKEDMVKIASRYGSREAIDISKMFSTQETINPEIVEKYKQSYKSVATIPALADTPIAIKIGKEYALVDGNHRVVAAKEKGATRAWVRVIDPKRVKDWRATSNAFCPTGPGGGQVNTCPPANAGNVQAKSGLPIGHVYTKVYKGVAHKIEVLTDGFKVTFPNGPPTGPATGAGPHSQVYSSLSSAAKGVKGSSSEVNGWAFFKIDKPAAAAPSHQPVPPQPAVPVSKDTIAYKDEHEFTTGKAEPGVLNGVAFGTAPPNFWEKTPDKNINEPKPVNTIQRSSVIVQEPDGRVWIVQPTNAYGQRNYTIPGGTNEPHLTSQQNALKELWEETGLQVEITGHLGDFEDSNTGRYGRLYIGKRIGGAPWDGKIESKIINHKTGKPDAESEKVILVKPDIAMQRLHRTDDLAQIATVQPIRLNTKSNGEMMKKLVEGVKPASKVWEKSQIAKGHKADSGDSTLHAVQNLRGFNGLPTLTSKSGMDALISAGTHIEMLRGVKPTGTMKAKELTDELKQGVHHPGFGCFGSGTYADSNKSSNANYRLDNRARQYAGYDGDIVRIALPKDAKIIKHSELEAKVGVQPSNYTTHHNRHNEQDAWLGVQAVLAGYDAIHIDGRSSRHGDYGQGFYVILNRSVVTIQRESAKGHVIK
jgi:SPP1 gp7 family putative phage head morphogenesis protein